MTARWRARDWTAMATEHADVLAPSMVRERLSWQEICARYPDEWVEMTDAEWENGDDEDGELLSAVVLGHAKTRDEVMRKTGMARLREGIIDTACRFTGPEFPPGEIISMRHLGF